MKGEDWDDVAVWRAVILQMLSDLTSNAGRNSLYRDEAHRWFFDASEQRQFVTVCEMAGYHPDFIRTAARKVIKRGICARAPVTMRSCE